jgi:AbiV family abortive infection protein
LLEGVLERIERGRWVTCGPMAEPSSTQPPIATYDPVQWIKSFEARLATLRPHPVPEVLTALSRVAWNQHGLAGVDSTEAAQQFSGQMKGAGRPVWTVPASEPLRAKLRISAIAAYENAAATLDDAKLLRANNRFARAKALAILAEEEFAKAFTLNSCASGARWDSAVLEALERHAPKQGIANAARRYAAWCQERIRTLQALQHNLIPVKLDIFPSPEEWRSMLDAGRPTALRDSCKQAALYVGISKSGEVTTNPADTDQESTDACIVDAENSRLCVEAVDAMFTDEQARLELRAAGLGEPPRYMYPS